jgi:RHS repeat-associated protein
MFDAKFDPFNGFRQVTRFKDRLNRVTQSIYDAIGNKLSEETGLLVDPATGQDVRQPETARKTWEYFPAGHQHQHKVSAFIDANGNRTDYGYDDGHRLIVERQPADAPGQPRYERRIAYDVQGRLVESYDQQGRKIVYGYDARDRVVRATYADGSSERWIFGTGQDANLLVHQVDRNDVVTNYGFDAAGRRIAVTRNAAKMDLSGNLIPTDPVARDLDLVAYVPGSLVVAERVHNGVLMRTQHDSRHRVVAETRFPRQGIALTTAFSYWRNQLFCQTDPYGRKTYSGYRSSDGAQVRTVHGLMPSFTVADHAALLAVARSGAPNPAFVVEDRELDSAGQVTATVDGRGSRNEMSYDARGNPMVTRLAVGTAESATTTTVFDPSGNKISSIGPRSTVVISYTGRNQVASITEAFGTSEASTTSYSYTATGKVAAVTDPLGRTTMNVYGTCCDRLAQVVDALGFMTRFSYDPVGNRTAVVDANGLTTTTTYDGLNRSVLVTNAAGETTVRRYDHDLGDGVGVEVEYPSALSGLGLGNGAGGQAIVTTDASGRVTVVVRDSLGRERRQVDGIGNAVTTEHDVVADGLLQMAVIDGLGAVRAYRSDGLGRIRSEIDPSGRVSQSAFDATGNRVSWRDANGVGQDCTFDARNREVVCTDTAGAVKRTTFDVDSNRTIEVDGLGSPTNHSYDLRNRKVSTRDRVGAVTVFAYDMVGNLLSITDAEGKVTQYSYNANNMLVRERFPDGQQTVGGADVRSYAYDAGRRLRARTDQAGVMATYAYDAANRLTSRQYGNGTPSDSFAYDAAGRLVRAESGQYGVVVTRTYDAAGRLNREAQVIDGMEFPVSYAYDAASRVVGQTYPDGTAIARGHAPRGELTSVSLGVGNVATRTYDVGGRLINTAFGNGVVETRTYAPGDNTVATIAAATAANLPVTAFTYVYDANKRKTVEMDGVVAVGDQRFGYDQQDRLTAWRRGAEAAPATQQSWSLTPVGDWASTIRDGVVEARTHTDVHEVATIAGAALMYDAKGNLTQAPGLPTLGWDVENRLRLAHGNGPAGAVQASYRYDALGRRVQKVVNGTATTYLSAGAQTVVEVVGKLLNAPWINPLPELIPPAIAGAPTGSILAQAGAGVVRVNFQPATSAVPVGWEADVGTAFAAQPSGHRFGWDSARTWSVDRAALDVPTWDTSVKLADDATAPAGAEWSVELPNGTYPVIVILGDAASREQTNTVTVNGQVQTDATPWIAGTPAGYEQGAFDGYAVTATVSDGRLRIRPVAGQSWNAKLCCIEIGAQGTAIDAVTQQRLADTVAMMNRATGSNRGTTPVVKRFAYGSYLDEVLAYDSVRKDRTQRYFVHSNHLYSPAALTDATGAVVERMTYDAYGRQAIMAADGKLLAKSNVGFSRGFTGYVADSETGLMYARARMYSPGLGRFISRDPWLSKPGIPAPTDGYLDGTSLYMAYFVPGQTDPKGTEKCYIRTGRQNKACPPSANGCGAEGGGKFPDGGWSWDFYPACAMHDICYGTCGMSKSACDYAFLIAMKQECMNKLSRWSPAFYSCYYQAVAYYTAVNDYGTGAYQAGQDCACEWDEFNCCDWDKKRCGSGRGPRSRCKRQ